MSRTAWYGCVIAWAITILTNVTHAQPPAKTLTATSRPEDVATQTIDLTSKDGRSYRVFIAQPDASPPAEGYQTLYVLDGNATFAEAVRARDNKADGKQPLLIIGVGYPTNERIDMVRRTYDLTPPADAQKLPPRPGGWPTWGGADQFLSFLTGELIPTIQARYKVDDDKQAIFGHSFGGLFVMHTLLNHPESFSTYFAASPSLWWNDYAIASDELRFVDAPLEQPASIVLALTVGELELTTDRGPAAALAPTEAKRTFGTTKDFAARLEKNMKERLRMTFEVFPNASHGDVTAIAIEKAVSLLVQ